jgi:cobalt-zinc-cadmium efflux system outer membrane protein
MPVLLFLLGVGVVMQAAVAQEMTEREALLRFAASSPRARALALSVEVARASARAEGLHPDGSITFSREAAAGVPETYLHYEQPLSLTGRRHFLRRAAEVEAESLDLSSKLQLHEWKVDLRLAFRELLLMQEQLAAYIAARGQLEDIVRIVSARERMGEASGYDRIRAERELSMFEAGVRGLEARLKRTQGLFASFFHERDSLQSVRAVGKLELPVVPDVELLISRSSNRGDIQSELQQAESSTLSMEAARRKRLPDPVVSGGLKSPSVGGQREGGYVFSVTVPLPLFDRGQADLARADAARRAALARAEAISSRVRLQIRGAWEEARRRIRAAELYKEKVGAQTEDLTRIARAAYEGGEVGILELLDAFRTDREFRLRSLELIAEAAQAAFELERLVGEEVIP